MLSVIIPTHESERALVPTLAALVPGATAGIIRDVIVADGGSRDDTGKVADIAGCRFVVSAEPLGARLRAAAAQGRGTWLMFIHPGTVPETGWVDELAGLIETGSQTAAVFRAPAGDLRAVLRRLLRMRPAAERGLVLPKSLYDETGGLRADAADPEADLIGRVGRRIITLRTVAWLPQDS
jgi:glycosyltransferase involved in cell wall biosynthesis